MLREKLNVVMSQVRRHVAVRISGIARRVWEMDTAEREKIIDPDILAMSENDRRAMQFSGGGGKRVEPSGIDGLQAWTMVLCLSQG
jgi:hypothetical protein